MFENWQKLVSTEKIFILFLRISILHEIKQNEKYPYASPFNIKFSVLSKMYCYYSQ